VLLVGTVGSATLFEPKAALVVRNRDDVELPLLLETVPAPAAFRDAIESLSPEQQRFAKAYRSMQLEGTLFAMVAIELKPQLERVLNLDADSLTKEIALVEELIDLLTVYDTPADVLSYDANTDGAGDATHKVAAVRRHAADIRAMVDKARPRPPRSARCRRWPATTRRPTPRTSAKSTTTTTTTAAATAASRWRIR